MEFLLDYANNIYMYGNELFKKFCKERNIKKSTVEGYNVVLNHYADFHGENINALFKEAYDDEKNKIPLKDRRIKNRLLDFRNHIISILSSSTAKTYSFLQLSSLLTSSITFSLTTNSLISIPFLRKNKVS